MRSDVTSDFGVLIKKKIFEMMLQVTSRWFKVGCWHPLMDSRKAWIYSLHKTIKLMLNSNEMSIKI